MKSVIVIAGPTGPTGTFQGVRILSAFTGPTGAFAQWSQLAGFTGPTGTFKTVYPTTDPKAKTVIIAGYAQGFRADTTQLRADTTATTADYSR